MLGLTECPYCGAHEPIEEYADVAYDFEAYEMRCPKCKAEWSLYCDRGEWWYEGDNDED